MCVCVCVYWAYPFLLLSGLLSLAWRTWLTRVRGAAVRHARLTRCAHHLQHRNFSYIYISVLTYTLRSSSFRAPGVSVGYVAHARARRDGSSRARRPLRSPPTAPVPLSRLDSVGRHHHGISCALPVHSTRGGLMCTPAAAFGNRTRLDPVDRRDYSVGREEYSRAATLRLAAFTGIRRLGACVRC